MSGPRFDRVTGGPISVVNEGVVDCTISARGPIDVDRSSVVCTLSTSPSAALLRGLVVVVSVSEDTVVVGFTSFGEGSIEKVEDSDIATVVENDCTVSVVTSGGIDDDSAVKLGRSISFAIEFPNLDARFEF